MEIFLFVEWNKVRKVRRGARSYRGEIVCYNIDHEQHPAIVNRLRQCSQIIRRSKFRVQLRNILTPETMIWLPNIRIAIYVFDYR